MVMTESSSSLGQRRILQGVAEEVGAQREQDGQRPAGGRAAPSGQQRREERVDLVLRAGEQLLHLVHDEQEVVQLGPRQDPVDDVGQPPVAQHRHERVRRGQPLGLPQIGFEGRDECGGEGEQR